MDNLRPTEWNTIGFFLKWYQRHACRCGYHCGNVSNTCCPGGTRRHNCKARPSQTRHEDKSHDWSSHQCAALAALPWISTNILCICLVRVRKQGPVCWQVTLYERVPHVSQTSLLIYHNGSCAYLLSIWLDACFRIAMILNFLYERLFGESRLERIIFRQRHVQTPSVIAEERIVLIRKDGRLIAR